MQAPESLAHPQDVVRVMVKYPLRWLIPAVIVGLAAFAFAAVRPDTWEASQTLIVRNEAVGNQDGPGKFRHSDELKTLVEKVLEVARSRTLLHDALAEVDGRAPTAETVSDTIDRVKLSPPKGAELGKTEMFYLKVKDVDRQRAIALAAAICRQLEARLSQLRNVRARSMVDELARTEQTLAASVATATEKLAALERSVGADLAELRTMNHSSSAIDSDLRRRSLEMESELRRAIDEAERYEAWQLTLRAAESDPARLLTLPAEGAETLAGLRRLKENLIDAQLRTAALRGTMTARHPQVLAALDAEREIATHFQNELQAAIRGATTTWQLAVHRVERLSEALPAMRKRMEQIAALRAEYARLVTEVDHQTQNWKEAQRALVAAQGALSSAETANLLTRIDTPETGTKPVGPGRSVIAAAGVAAGLVLGLGVLLLSLPPAVGASPEPVNPPLRQVASEIVTPPEPVAGPTMGLSLQRALRKLVPL